MTYEFVFEHAKTFTAKITQIDLRWDEAKNDLVEAKRTDLGETKLSENEITGLDRLFAFYRSKKLGGCTTVDHISATQKSGDVVKATESFTDESCTTSNMKGVTRLRDIVEKLDPKTK